MNGIIESINPMSFDSGPGIRIEVILVNENGISLSPKEMVDRIRKFRAYIGPDGGGVTFKGNIFDNIEFLKEICLICNKAGINTCIETNGFDYNLDRSVFKYLNLVILSIESLPLFNYNKVSIDNLMNVDKFINDANEGNINIWIKQEIKKDINNSNCYIDCLRKYLNRYSNIQNIELFSNDILVDDLEILKRKLNEV